MHALSGIHPDADIRCSVVADVTAATPRWQGTCIGTQRTFRWFVLLSQQHRKSKFEREGSGPDSRPTTQKTLFEHGSSGPDSKGGPEGSAKSTSIRKEPIPADAIYRP